MDSRDREEAPWEEAPISLCSQERSREMMEEPENKSVVKRKLGVTEARGGKSTPDCGERRKVGRKTNEEKFLMVREVVGQQKITMHLRSGKGGPLPGGK